MKYGTRLIKRVASFCLLLLLFAFMALGTASGEVAVAEEIGESTPSTSTTDTTEVEGNNPSETTPDENADVFTRFFEWYQLNKDRLIGIAGVVVTLFIIPLIKNIANGNLRLSDTVTSTDKNISKVGATLTSALDRVNEWTDSYAQLTAENKRLESSLSALSSEVTKNNKLVAATANSIYTAFMASNIPEGTKSIIAGVIAEAMNYDDGKRQAVETIDKSVELIDSALSMVANVKETLSSTAAEKVDV